jgi:exopolysaccharide biosynthesis polyprenyl glycosylphosphotransferase
MEMLSESEIGAARAERPWMLASPVADRDFEPPLRRLFPSSKEHLRLKCYLALCTVDILCIGAAFLLAGMIRLGSPFPDQALSTAKLVISIFLAVALNNHAYSIDALRRPAAGVLKALEAFAYATAVAIMLIFYLKVSMHFSRVIFAVATCLAIAFIVAGRVAAVRCFGGKHKWCFTNDLVIVDGANFQAQAGQTVVLASHFGIEPRMDDPFALNRLNCLLERCDRLVIACSPDRRARWAQALKGTALDVEILAPELAEIGAVSLRSLNGQQTLVVSSKPLNTRDRFLKRALDIIVAVGALVLFAPLMLLVGLAVKLDSRGPVLFKQQRVGRNNRLFNVIKFRSMRVDVADPLGSSSVCRSDTRLTRVGAFIRKTSLDELPQLLNVLGGSMSIVGPRPHALGSTAEDALFWMIDPRYFQRHAMKPGITGLAQIRGFRGNTERRGDLTSRLAADLEYRTNWNIWRDIKIMFATFGVLIHPNAF